MFFIGLHFIIMTHVSLIKPQLRKKVVKNTKKEDKEILTQVYYKKSHEKTRKVHDSCLPWDIVILSTHTTAINEERGVAFTPVTLLGNKRRGKSVLVILVCT